MKQRLNLLLGSIALAASIYGCTPQLAPEPTEDPAVAAVDSSSTAVPGSSTVAGPTSSTVAAPTSRDNAPAIAGLKKFAQVKKASASAGSTVNSVTRDKS